MPPPSRIVDSRPGERPNRRTSAPHSARSAASERQQGTLEPVLTTPIRREELLLAKALAALLSAAVAYAVYTLFRACVERFALRTTTSALVHSA